MKRTSLLVAPLALVVAIGACNGSKTTPAEERSPGEMAFRTSCQTCHTLPRPTMKSAEEWPELVARYGERASLTPEKIEIIAEYLIASTDR